MRLTVGRALIPSFSKVDSDVERDYYWKALLSLWTGRSKKRDPASFPGCNPCSLGRRDLSALHAHEYVIALKSDGVRYALFLTLRPSSDSPIALMIDRSGNMYEVEVIACEEYFSLGTILEGELVWKQPDESQLLYLVFDAVCIKGRRLSGDGFVERLDAAARCTRFSEELAAVLATSSNDEVEQRVAETDCIAMVHFDPPVSMRPKHFVDRAFADRLWNDRGDAEHRVDGIILHKAHAPYCVGTSTGGAIFKWKEHSTIDLSGKVTALRGSDGPLGTMLLAHPVAVRPGGRVHAERDDEVLEYLVSIVGGTVELFAMRKRPDKLRANSLKVIASTVQDCIDAILPSELCAREEPSGGPCG